VSAKALAQADWRAYEIRAPKPRWHEQQARHRVFKTRRHAQEAKGSGIARSRPILARAERRAGGLLLVLCSTGNTREASSVEAWNRPGRGWYCGWGVCPAKEGGSDGVSHSDRRRAMVGRHGNLQSAGRRPSSPLYCRARQLRRDLLFVSRGTRGTCSSSAR
jgi:hypothetical protein